jgi:hypothetical protein
MIVGIPSAEHPTPDGSNPRCDRVVSHRSREQFARHLLKAKHKLTCVISRSLFMNRLSPLVEIKFLLALALFAPFVASAEDEEKIKDGSFPKQVHYPVAAVELIANLKKNEEALYKIKSL